ncbi:MAG: hypothetical protein IKL85_09300, partial [Lentisphaeria bacterium]|nr:hypothetical protein [Lentisphaeria bacterium]
MKSKLLLAGSILVSGLLVTSCQLEREKLKALENKVYDGADLEPAGNPIFTDAWTADPAPLVVGNRVYVYTGEDVYRDGEQNGLPGNYNIADWRCYSSDDLVHWRSHGVLLRPEQFPSGIKGTAWASQV